MARSEDEEDNRMEDEEDDQNEDDDEDTADSKGKQNVAAKNSLVSEQTKVAKHSKEVEIALQELLENGKKIRAVGFEVADAENKLTNGKSSGGEEKTNALLKACEEHYASLVRALLLSQKRDSALEAVSRKLSQGDCTELEKLVLEELEKANSVTDSEVKNHVFMQKWREEVTQEDQEISVMNNDEFPLKCPISFVDMEKPMKSKKCGHIFSQKSLVEYYQKKKKPKCPAAGCNKVVHLSDFYNDEALEEELASARRKKARADNYKSIGSQSQEIE